jgi:hypothetical protein
MPPTQITKIGSVQVKRITVEEGMPSLLKEDLMTSKMM